MENSKVTTGGTGAHRLNYKHIRLKLTYIRSSMHEVNIVFMNAKSHVCLFVRNNIAICNSCNTDMNDLLDMYAQILTATGMRAEAIHIKQIMSAYISYN